MSDKIDIDVKSLAELARMEVSEEEVVKLEKELPAILGFVDTIQKADVAALERDPSLRNVMREDGEPHPGGMFSERLLAEAPAVKKDQLVVKQVVSRKK